ncbi:hypothetical protein HYX16_06355, partial [Candidatus Woesearchaeota archaeon]|nr:hypothetical protein [Candidatus Woesearchaeota archaeon]
MLNKQKIFALYTIFILIFSIGAFAQEAAPTVDPGLTPDSALYGVELFAEDVQLLFTFNPVSKVELAASFVEERHTEMDVMLQQENYDGLAEVAGVMQEDLVVLQEAADDIPATEENLEIINSIEKTAIIEGNHVDEVHTELIARVETGAVTEEVVESIELSAVEKATTDVQVSSEETKNEVVDVISAEKGISSIEAEVIVEKSNEESGLTELQEVEVKEEIVKTEDKIEQLELEISRSVDAGYDIAEAKALSHVIEESKTRLQISIDNYENGLIGNSFLELVNTEQLILNTEAFVDDPEEINIVELDEAVIKDQQEREEDSKKYVEEYDIYKDELSDKYPDKAEEFEHVYETQKQVVEITDKLDEVYEREVAKLQDEGKTEDEAASIIAQRFAEEYRIAYGEEYLPPIISEEEGLPTEGIDAGSVFHSEEDLRLIGGVIEDYNYIDPNSGFEYQFNSKGYEYTTPLGFTYSKDFADNVEVLESYQKGDEVYTHTESTTEGTVDYNYFTTGYEVVMPDGTTETFAYPTGEHDFVGGGEVSIEATGFEVTTESGETSKYDYNPKFDTYVSQEGTVLAPPEGASIHNSE